MQRKHLLLVIAAVMVLAAGIVALWRYRQVRRTPEYSLLQLAAAFQAKDRLGVEEYLDVHGTATSAVDELVGAVIADATRRSQTQQGFEAMGTLLGVQMLSGMKPTAVAMIEQSVWASLGDSTAANAASHGDSTSLFNKQELDFAQTAAAFRGVAEVQERGDAALVKIRMQRTDLDSVRVVTVRMQRVGDHWRVIGLPGIGAILQAERTRGEEEAYVASMKSDLRNLVVAEELFYADSVRYTALVRRLQWRPTPGNVVVALRARQESWTATLSNPKTPTRCTIFVGKEAVAPATAEGAPACQ